MDKIAVIGAAGEVGYRLIQRLSGRYRVNAIVRDPRKRDFQGFSYVNVFVVTDVSDIESLAAAFEGCSVIVNAAYIQFAENIFAAVSAVDDNRVEHIIFTGSTGIYTKLESKSARDKINAEKFIRDRLTIPWTILRPTMIYGHADDRNFARLIRFINRSLIIPVIGDGGALIQPVYIYDLIELMDRSILNRSVFNSSFDVAGAMAHTSGDVFRICAKLLGKKRIVLGVPHVVIQAAISLLGVLGKAPLSQEQILRFMEDKDVDIRDLEIHFEFVPTAIEDGLRKQIRDMRRGSQL